MPFFEPQPADDEAESKERAWSPPAWDRPSEGMLGGYVPSGQLIGRTEGVVLVLDHVLAYPSGFVLALKMVPNPRREIAPHRFFGPQRFPRVGVEFSDGRTAGSEASDPRSGPVLARSHGAVEKKDDDGMPTQPVLRFVGGGGGMHTFGLSLWIHPLPSPGELKVYVEWPTAGMPETRIVLDADTIRDAADRAVVIWE